VNVVAEGDRVVSREEVVELADAVSAWCGIASGIGTTGYGAQLVVEADDRDTAIQRASGGFVRAAAQAGLPPWPIASVVAVSEAEDALPRWPASPEPGHLE
jgi:hypothetical protein